MIKSFNANHARKRRHRHIRRRVEGTPVRPRLNVFRSGTHIYAQVIDDTTGKTLAQASSRDESFGNFVPPEPVVASHQAGPAEEVPLGTEPVAAPAAGKGAKADAAAKGAKAQQPKGAKPGAQQAKGGKPGTQAKTVLPAAQKREKKTPQEALIAIASNRKVALAREVGKLVAERAKEQGIAKVVFDRGGYAYHGRVAALAEGARSAGLDF
jgi:ribosomal protein L18